MKVSICCSVLNQSELLKGMIENVREQVFKDWELVLVDDGSTEDIKGIVDSFNDERIKYHLFPENKGVPHGMNYALTIAQGEYVSVLSTDERLEPNKLLWQTGFLDDNPKVEALWGLPQNGELGERPLWEQNLLKAHNRSNASWVKTLLNLDHVPIGGASMLLRRSILKSIGLFDPQFYTTSDLEWFVRFFEKGHKGLVLPYRWAYCVDNPKALSKNVKPEDFRKDMENVRSHHLQRPPRVMSEITVGIPVRNMADTIAATINSLLKQTWQNFRIVVFNDASTDNTSDIVESFKDPRIKLYEIEENIGVNAAQNQMLARCETPFFAVLAADDTVEPNWIERLMVEFVTDPYREFVACQTDFIGKDGLSFAEDHPFKTIRKASNLPDKEHWKQLLFYGNVYFGAGIYRTEALKDIGGWDEKAGVISDYDVYLKLIQRENIHIVEENLVHTRIHDKNRSILRQRRDQVKLKWDYKYVKDQFYKPVNKIIISTPFYEMRGFSPYISSMVSTVRMLTQLGIAFEFWELSGDSYVDRAKNTIMTKFLQEEPDASHLFMIDSDMQWNAEAVVKMLALPDEVVVGSYPQKNGWSKWTSLPEVTEENGKKYPIGRDLGNGVSLLKAEYLAGGFMMIRRSALEKFRDAYPELRYKDMSADPGAPEREYINFSECITEGGLRWGEDRIFGKRLKKLGIDPMIYTDIEFGHYGIKGWMGNFHQALQGKVRNQDPNSERIH